MKPALSRDRHHLPIASPRLIVLHHLERTFLGGAPHPIRALHWSADGISVAPGRLALLTRAGEGGEAFRWRDNVWGIQFHPEADADVLDGWYSDVAWLQEAGVEEETAREADRLHLPGQR